MKIIDISWPITQGMSEYKDRDSVRLTQLKSCAIDGVADSSIALHTHTGTHIDAPAHFIADGRTVEQISLEYLIGTCRVLDLAHVAHCITQEDLEPYDLRTGEIILCKTRNSALAPTACFDYEFVYMAQSAAHYCVARGIKTVGIDYLGIERNQPGHPTHRALLNAGVIIIEGLRLAPVAPRRYQLYCLPLSVQRLDAAPARAILIDEAF